MADIKRNKEKILKFKSEIVELGVNSKAKTMKLGDDRQLDEAVYLWFAQKRMEGVPVSGLLLREKALELSKKLHGDTSFTASDGWKWRFCRRHGIRQLSVQGEKLSGNEEQAAKFVVEFQKFIKEQNLSLYQILNSDESDLFFRLLPDCTLVACFEKSVSGRKKSKDRVTLNFCSNASGTIKMPIHLIGKAKRPRCFKGIDMNLLPVKYTSQTNAWMTTVQFSEWFHRDFVPTVREKLIALGEELRAVLVLDNCSAHPDAEDLVSDDGAIVAKFLPANVTALIQPMDQGVIQVVKKRYKKKLLTRLVMEEESGKSIVEFIKGINLKVVVELIAESWQEITDVTLRRSWRKIIPIKMFTVPVPPDPALAELYELTVAEEPVDALSPPTVKKPRGCGVWKGLRIRISHSDAEKPIADDHSVDEVPTNSFLLLFRELGIQIQADEIEDWLNSDAHDSGVQIFSDDEICEFVSRDDPKADEEEDEEDEEEPCPVTNSDAARMFEWGLTWLEHQPEASVYNTSVLRELHA